MALAAERALSAKLISGGETIVEFSPRALRAPFVLRCAAVAVDYMVLVSIPVLWLVLSRLFADNRVNATIGPTPWIIGAVLFVANFLIFPMLRGRTLGKLLVGLTIVNLDGTRVRASSVVGRNIFGYALTILTFGIGFLIAAVNSSGRALHDFVGGTIVVHGRKTQS
ncbi:MAG: RDD family protein [Pyrinomonadaceae bacterium]